MAFMEIYPYFHQQNFPSVNTPLTTLKIILLESKDNYNNINLKIQNFKNLQLDQIKSNRIHKNIAVSLHGI